VVLPPYLRYSRPDTGIEPRAPQHLMTMALPLMSDAAPLVEGGATARQEPALKPTRAPPSRSSRRRDGFYQRMDSTRNHPFYPKCVEAARFAESGRVSCGGQLHLEGEADRWCWLNDRTRLVGFDGQATGLGE
jgi:hypothetical protein